MISKQNTIFKAIVITLTLMGGVSSGNIIPQVACIENDGKVNIETGCSILDLHGSSDNNTQDNIEQCIACVDIPLSQYLPKINQVIKSEIQGNIFDSFEIISLNSVILEQNNDLSDYAQQLFAINDQSKLAMISTRLLL